MAETAPLDPDAGLVPAFAVPAGACDAHFHVFGPQPRYAYDASDLRYQPPHAPLDDYLRLARRLGFERFVFVQPSAYGMDNSCMLDAMRELSADVRRAIVHLDETKAKDAELDAWNRFGVRGVRSTSRRCAGRKQDSRTLCGRAFCGSPPCCARSAGTSIFWHPVG